MVSQKISRKTIDTALSDLKQLPVKKKESFALREAIYEMRKDIEAILKKGYSFEEVADFLSDHEIQIKPVTLKQYMTSFKRKPKKKVATGDVGAGVSASPVRRSSGDSKAVKRVVEDSAAQDGSRVDVKPGEGFVDVPDDL